MTSTHQKKIARTSSTEDRISSLPDALISHILSFLPTKLAVATSVLSKRWIPLWKSVLTLDINNESFKDSESFRQFAHSLVVMRDAMLPIQRIRCVISSNVDPRDLNRFVQAAAQRGLEICDLNCDTIPCLFSCKTLVVLNLAFLEVHEVPNLVDLPLLKTLHLDETQFKCSFVHFMNLLRGCPILEELIMNHPQIPNDFVEVGEFKGFSKLVKAYIYSKESFLFPWVYNVKFLFVELAWDCFYGVPPTFHNLTNMELYLCYSRPLEWELIIQVLQHCPNLQKLTIDEAFAHFILPTGDRDWTEPETIPECLSSQLRKCSLRGFRAMECELHFAEYILLNSKLLCTMKVKSSYFSDIDEKHQILVKLSSYPRGSTTCKLLFDSQPVFISQ